MKIIRQIFVILLFYVLGEGIALGIRTLFPEVFIPGTLIGMGLMLWMLLSKRLKPEHVEDVGGFLTGNMSFFFLPAAISILEYLDLLQSSLLAILAVVVITLYMSFFAVAYAVKWTISWQAKRGEGRE